MRILVVGGAGYIGFDLCKALKSMHYDVTVLDISSARMPQLLAADIRLLVGRISGVIERKDLMAAFDVVINLTGGLDDAHLHGLGPVAMEQSCGPLYIRDSCPEARLVHISTQYVYSSHEMNKERSTPEPSCDYGIVHVMAESSVNNDPNAVVLRFGTVWGIGTFTRWDTWGNHLVHLMKRSQPVDLYYPNNMICLLSLKNAIRSVVWALTGDPGVYNVADTIGIQEDVAKEVLGPYVYTNRPFTDGFSIGMDCNKIQRKGFEFKSHDLGFENA